MFQRAFVVANLCLCSLLFLFSNAEATPDSTEAPYTITDLGSLENSTSTSIGSAVNATGQVAGYSLINGDSHAFLFANGTMQDIGTLGGPYSYAFGINDGGKVVGRASTAGASGDRAFVYSKDSGIVDLNTSLPPGTNATLSYATGINNAEQIAAFGEAENQGVRAFLYANGAIQDLGTLGGYNSFSQGINQVGWVTGYSSVASGYSHAFLYSMGKMRDLGTLGGIESFGIAVNNTGQVTGTSYTATYPDNSAFKHAFLYANGVMKDLGTLGGTFSWGYGINSVGQVVGNATDSSGASRAFLYSLTTGMVDLNTLLPDNSGWRLLSANAISDKGQVTGFGLLNGVGTHAFLLTPTFPKTIVLDDFDRSDGKLGKSWSGDKDQGSYRIRSDQVRVRNGGTIFWQSATFGVDQEAFVTLTNVDRNGRRQGLVLKAQGPGPDAEPDFTNGAIHAIYDAKMDVVTLRTYIPRGRDWTSYPPVTLKFEDGDQLGARVYATGQVRIYKNYLPVWTITLNTVDQSFFNHRGGRIGLKFDESADKAVLDNFGGGTTP